MKIFDNWIDADKSLDKKEKVFINSMCPYNKNHYCGNWCALFYCDKGCNGNTAHIILGCKAGTDKKLYLG